VRLSLASILTGAYGKKIFFIKCRSGGGIPYITGGVGLVVMK
jgi:hypothetical protein